MRPAIAILLVVAGTLCSGCSLCAPGYLCDYAGVGGKWQRSDPENGRVGSILSDPNGFVGSAAPAAEIIIDASEYQPSGDNGTSIIESPMIVEPMVQEGVIILGDDW